MKIVKVESLALPEVKLLTVARFCDERGYFSNLYRQSDLAALTGHPDLQNLKFVEASESRSKAKVVRGLHFQWNPHMGKLVRTVAGRMVDLVLDIRPNSPRLGRIILHDMPADFESEYDQWLWVPPGFAHGNFYPQDGAIEYFCTGEYNPACEAAISPFSPDLDWTLASSALKAEFDGQSAAGLLQSDKDRNGLSLKAWLADPRAVNFSCY